MSLAIPEPEDNNNKIKFSLEDKLLLRNLEIELGVEFDKVPRDYLLFLVLGFKREATTLREMLKQGMRLDLNGLQ